MPYTRATCAEPGCGRPVGFVMIFKGSPPPRAPKCQKCRCKGNGDRRSVKRNADPMERAQAHHQ